MDEKERKKAILKKKREAMAYARSKKKNVKVADDPRKQDFLKRYYDPQSETYANAYRSALEAGYKPTYAKAIKSPSIGNKWVSIDNYTDRYSMTPEHILASFERLALRSPKEETQLKALEHLAKLKGMLVEKKITAHVNIEDVLNDVAIDTEATASD